MCEPMTIIAGAGLVMSAIGVGTQAYAANKEAKAANAAAEYNASIQERNAEIANIQANDAIARGDIAEKQYRLGVSKMVGEQRASMGASGVVVDTGSALDVNLDTVEQGELDALTIRHNASLEAWALKNQAAESIGNASLFRATKRSPGMAATSTLLTGGGQIAGQAANYGYLSKGGSIAKAGV